MHKSAKNRRFSNKMLGISLILSIIGLVFAFIIPISKQDRHSWVIGPMSSSHKFIEGNCSSCHAAPFSAIKDESCLTCHNVSVHPVSNPAVHPVDNQNKEARDYRKLQPTCVDCHLEHSGDNTLVISDPRTCISCHGNLKSHYEKTKLRDVLDFKSHPEFTLPKIDNAKIKLNHEVHLKKDLRSDKGYKTLACGDCHQMNGSQKLMTPVSYEAHCSSCHKLEIDGENGVKKIPHAKPSNVFDFIFKENLAWYYLKNTKTQASETEILRKRPGEETDDLAITVEVLKSSRDIETEIFIDRGCALCHFINKLEDSANLSETESQYKIEKTDVPKKWFLNAEFKHLSHEILTCESCHEGIRKSSKTEDVSMPKIKDCNSCHSKQGGASQDCTTCHSYHQSLSLSEHKKIENFHAANIKK